MPDELGAEAEITVGRVLSQEGKWAEAAVAYGRAAALQPDSADAHGVHGQALAKSGDWAAAASAYQRALQLSPSSVRHHDLGDALLHLGRLDEAAAAYRQAEDCNPRWARRDVGAAVAAAERWIEDLTATASTLGSRRTLFILDNDYGELTTAKYLLLGQDLASGATLLLPPRLFVTNRDVLPGRTRSYATIDDVIGVVDEMRPEIVFLCSAYLFSLHGIFTSAGLARLVRHVRQRGARIVTTDPFLGLLSQAAGRITVSVDIPASAPPWLRQLKEIEDERLNRCLGEAAETVGMLPHLYPSAPAPGDDAASDENRVSFFNRRLLSGPSIGTPAPGVSPLWLFVLSSRDYEAQLMRRGRDGCAGMIANYVEQAIAAGCHPVFVGPFDSVQALVHHLAAAGQGALREGVTLLTFGSFTRFSALLISAEYAFYWNALSHSMFLRLFSGRPFFLFDRGHLVRNVPAIYERVVDWYYQGHPPIYLEPGTDLRVDHLNVLANEYRQAARAVQQRVARLPSPAELIDHLAL